MILESAEEDESKSNLKVEFGVEIVCENNNFI